MRPKEPSGGGAEEKEEMEDEDLARRAGVSARIPRRRRRWGRSWAGPKCKPDEVDGLLGI
ncbi:hypothetical protein VTJ04DRAFT_2309 [Mycothermus thermophilus]|uniref:uncharacterized protein n=1 Tax=Humicola insolens TaxID=85995 RepID=UPI003743C8D9